MNNLRKIRRSMDMTQEQLGKAIGSPKSYVCDLEKGNVRNPSLGKARLIAMALNSTLEEVFPTMNELEKFWKIKSAALGSKNHLVTKVLENNPLKVIKDLNIEEFLSQCNDEKLKKNGKHAFLSMLKTKAKLEIERLKR